MDSKKELSSLDKTRMINIYFMSWRVDTYFIFRELTEEQIDIIYKSYCNLEKDLNADIEQSNDPIVLRYYALYFMFRRDVKRMLKYVKLSFKQCDERAFELPICYHFKVSQNDFSHNKITKYYEKIINPHIMTMFQFIQINISDNLEISLKHIPFILERITRKLDHETITRIVYDFYTIYLCKLSLIRDEYLNTIRNSNSINAINLLKYPPYAQVLNECRLLMVKYGWIFKIACIKNLRNKWICLTLLKKYKELKDT
ncbi:MAG: hypothetical protein Satyrvirus28_1 [Satyrvirus sp.]|uniref:Uncharacterized protein n=1 Tax=Satyrvirus sp. TaxID=2487771 RepID=A0A3G5AIM3_9VIRU|nr:MAG: hypothetical protein Satyrvirus28_1 [Satyrvirus sp.]